MNLEHFLERESKNPKNKGKMEICHGLLRCQMVTPRCKIC